MRPLLITAIVVAMAGGSAVAGSVAWVRHAADSHVYQPADAPRRPVAVVLGAMVYADGTPSPVLADRLGAALRLYQRGQVRAVLVTGDNGTVRYNEVDPMRQWLIARGVPERKVVGDYAGFDTYNSCVRAVRIFGVRAAILVTQEFHLRRAVALCRGIGMDAVGVIAGTDGLTRQTLLRLSVRDNVACVKAVAQVVIRPDPTYLGRHETGIEVALSEP